MHLHPRHVHVHVELHVAGIDKLTVAIAKFDQDFIATLAELALWMNEVHRQVVHSLSREWRAGNFVGRKFLPEEITRVKQRDDHADQRDPS